MSNYMRDQDALFYSLMFGVFSVLFNFGISVVIIPEPLTNIGAVIGSTIGTSIAIGILTYGIVYLWYNSAKNNTESFSISSSSF